MGSQFIITKVYLSPRRHDSCHMTLPASELKYALEVERIAWPAALARAARAWYAHLLHDDICRPHPRHQLVLGIFLISIA